MDQILNLAEPKNGTKYLFFGGKGGVGKTTMAAATAVWMANSGYNTTIVSTDPTISLSAIFHQEISATAKTKIHQVKNLCGININPLASHGCIPKQAIKNAWWSNKHVGWRPYQYTMRRGNGCV